MSSTLASEALPAGGLSPLAQAREPAWVREGSPEVQQAYETALGFEEMLAQQLTQSLAESAGLGEGEGEAEGGEESSGGGAAMEMQTLLPQALAEGIGRQGGLGLATELTRELDRPTAPVGGPTGAAATTTAKGGA